jgi:hypothetical protein
LNNEFDLVAIRSGNGEESCLAVNKESFIKLYQNMGMINEDHPIESWTDICENWYVELVNGEKLYNVFDYVLLDMFHIERYYKDYKGAVGFRAKVVVEPIYENEINRL